MTIYLLHDARLAIISSDPKHISGEPSVVVLKSNENANTAQAS